jgi:hypothetical protein
MRSSDFNALNHRGLLLAGAAGVALLCGSAPAFAQSDPVTRERLNAIEAQLKFQGQQLSDQERRLTDQEQLIQTQALELHAMHAERDQLIGYIRAGSALATTQGAPGGPSGPALAPGSVQLAAQQGVGPTPDDATPTRPVGQAPPEEPQKRVREVAAIPEGLGVLTPPGRLVIDPSIEYSRTSNNRLVFRGVEIVPGVQLGVIEASNADRDTLVGTLAVRYGLTNRIEVEARMPYLYRQDRVTTVQQRDQSVSQSKRLEGQDLGDLELAARYQINRGLKGWPVFVANFRVKPPTGTGPFDVNYDTFGVATDLATGSGFWAYSAGVTMIYPTDPAVIFASLGYLYNQPHAVDKLIGQQNAVFVGTVKPGDSISASFGFGLALNPRFSFSLGYSHSYIFQTDTDLGSSKANVTTQRSNALQVGSMLLGWSFRLNDRVTLSNNFEFGVTSDAPDMRMVIRFPYRF